MPETKIYRDVLPLDTIAEKLANHLQGHKREVAYCKDEEHETWFFIQTRRHGDISFDKCLNIFLEGTRDECKITIESGKWGESTVDSSNKPALIPYDGIMESKKSSLAPIITAGHIWKYLDKNI